MSLIQGVSIAYKTIDIFRETIGTDPGSVNNWYIGVASDPLGQLKDHGIDLTSTIYLYETFQNALVPAFIKDHFLNLGVDGQRTIFHTDYTSVYLFKKSADSNP